MARKPKLATNVWDKPTETTEATETLADIDLAPKGEEAQSFEKLLHNLYPNTPAYPVADDQSAVCLRLDALDRALALHRDSSTLAAPAVIATAAAFEAFLKGEPK